MNYEMVKSKKQRKHLEKLNQKGKNHPAWKGGIRRGNPYIRFYSPTHPYCDDKGYVKRSRLIMEKHIGRTLTTKEIVHHINGIKDDDRIENLMLFQSSGSHISFELKGRKLSKKWKKKIGDANRNKKRPRQKLEENE